MNINSEIARERESTGEFKDDVLTMKGFRLDTAYVNSVGRCTVAKSGSIGND